MSDIKKLEGELEAKIHDAFNRLRADAQKIIDDLTFRIKQGLHPTNHDPVDSQGSAASEALAKALEAARSSLVDSQEQSAPTPAAGSATAVGAMGTANSGLLDGAGATDAETKPAQEGEQTKPAQEGDEGKPDQQA